MRNTFLTLIGFLITINANASVADFKDLMGINSGRVWKYRVTGTGPSSCPFGDFESKVQEITSSTDSTAVTMLYWCPPQIPRIYLKITDSEVLTGASPTPQSLSMMGPVAETTHWQVGTVVYQWKNRGTYKTYANCWAVEGRSPYYNSDAIYCYGTGMVFSRSESTGGYFDQSELLETRHD